MPLNPPIECWHALRRLALWLLLAWLAVGLPLQASSSVLAGILGPRHGHQSGPAEKPPDDPMAGWTDFRRASHGHRDHDGAGGRRAEAPAGSTPHASAHRHAHAHDDGLRHHHAKDDAGVIDLEAPADDDGAPAGSAHGGSFAVMPAAGDRVAPPQRAAGDDGAWRSAAARSFTSAFPRRIERPPARG